jgi:hypothetical protein
LNGGGLLGIINSMGLLGIIDSMGLLGIEVTYGHTDYLPANYELLTIR